jgi:hypothetical protein
MEFHLPALRLAEDDPISYGLKMASVVDDEPTGMGHGDRESKMRTRTNLIGLPVVVLCLMAGMMNRAGAGQIGLNAADWGWYDEMGYHDPSNVNYVAISDVTFNFFVFDLSGIDDEIIGAELRLFNPAGGFNSFGSDMSANYTIHDVTTPISELVAGSSDATNIFADLGSGIGYGMTTVSAADNGSVVSISLNSDALQALNAMRGGLFAVGGSVAPFNGFVFGFTTGDETEMRQLVLTTQAIPEPASMLLMGLGLGSLGLFGYGRLARSRASTPG